MRKKLILGISILAGLFLISVLLLILLAVISPCDVQVEQKVVSPDQTYIVRTTTTNCHTTSPFVADVEIEKLKNPSFFKSLNRETVFSSHSVAAKVNVSWVEDNVLKVSYQDCEVYGKDDSWGDVKIVYDSQCE